MNVIRATIMLTMLVVSIGIVPTRAETGEPASSSMERGADADGVAYSLDDCIRIGLERSATAANAARDREIADARVIQARSEAIPGLAVRAGYTRLDELQAIDFGDEPVTLGSLDNYEITAEVNQLLYSGGRVKAGLRAAGQAREYADWSQSEIEARLVRDIRIGFYDILLARSAVQVREASLAQLTALLEQTEEKFKRGRASEFDVITSQVQLANERPECIRAVNTYALAAEAFKKLIHIEADNAEFVGELTYHPMGTELEALTAEAMANRPALQALEVLVGLREEDLRASRSGALPDLRTYFLYTGANSYRFVSFEDRWDWHWNAGVVFSWPLWDGGLTLGKVREKRLEVDKSLTDLDEFERAVRLEVRQAFLDMRHAEETVAAGRDNVALAEKALKIAGVRYDAGLATRLEFADANLALNTAKLSWHRALRDHMAALARLEYARGRSAGPKQQDGENE